MSKIKTFNKSIIKKPSKVHYLYDSVLIGDKVTLKDNNAYRDITGTVNWVGKNGEFTLETSIGNINIFLMFKEKIRLVINGKEKYYYRKYGSKYLI